MDGKEFLPLGHQGTVYKFNIILPNIWGLPETASRSLGEGGQRFFDNGTESRLLKSVTMEEGVLIIVKN